jgi:hypothetical protein
MRSFYHEQHEQIRFAVLTLLVVTKKVTELRGFSRMDAACSVNAAPLLI